MEQTKRHALVTGGGSGIGLAIAAALLKAGHDVTILGRTAAKLEAARAQHPGLNALCADVTDADQLAQAFHGTPPIDILINNAGGVKTAPFAKMSQADWRAALDLNFFGTLNCIDAALPGMVARGWGRIINIGSTAGLKGYGYVTAYCAAKHAVVGLTRALALEIAKKGVTINALCPGYADTDIIRKGIETIQSTTGRSYDDALATFTKTNPQGRLVQPEEVAAAVLWLAADTGAAVNGAAIPIAGGEV